MCPLKKKIMKHACHILLGRLIINKSLQLNCTHIKRQKKWRGRKNSCIFHIRILMTFTNSGGVVTRNQPKIWLNVSWAMLFFIFCQIQWFINVQHTINPFLKGELCCRILYLAEIRVWFLGNRPASRRYLQTECIIF